MHHDKEAGTVTLASDLAFALLDLVSYPPIRRGQYVSNAGVPWRRIEEIRAMLDREGFDWRGVHAGIAP